MNKMPTAKSAIVTKVVPIILFGILLGLFGWLIWTRHVNKQPATQQDVQKYAMFEGTVTGRNNGCAYDDACTVSVDNKVIVTGGGLTANPDANIYGVTDVDLSNGDKVSVKALNTDHGLTLQGCQECYITRGEARRR
jgi:hypothetical protein